MAVVLLPAGILSTEAAAQAQTREERERELRMQEEFEIQKKAIADQKKAQEEYQKLIQEQNADTEKSLKEAKDIIERSERYKEFARDPKAQGSPFPIPESLMHPPGYDRPYGWFVRGDNERIAWDFSRSVKETTFSRVYAFEVEPTFKNAVLSVNGDCKAGEIRIKVFMPNGKLYSDILIDEFGNINWKKSFTISEEENRDKAGEWRFQVNATKATGFFKISLLTY